MMCDCYSYNGDVGTVPSVVLPRPWFMEGTDRRPDGIPVDACIADLVSMLWENRVVTLASCCGHGRDDLPPPSVVLGNGEDPERAAYLIAEHDNREITLFQWRLVDVSKTAGPPMIPEPVKPSPMMSERSLPTT